MITIFSRCHDVQPSTIWSCFRRKAPKDLDQKCYHRVEGQVVVSLLSLVISRDILRCRFWSLSCFYSCNTQPQIYQYMRLQLHSYLFESICARMSMYTFIKDRIRVFVRFKLESVSSHPLSEAPGGAYLLLSTLHRTEI